MNTPTLSPVAAGCGFDAERGSKATARYSFPAALADVALIDAPGIAAAACMSMSTWHELVRVGDAPQPAIRAPRHTRWRMADVRAWLAARAERGSNSDAARSLVANARKASIKAREPAAVAKAQATKKARIAARDGVSA